VLACVCMDAVSADQCIGVCCRGRAHPDHQDAGLWLV
jgi:hypothetical protein